MSVLLSSSIALWETVSLWREWLNEWNKPHVKDLAWLDALGTILYMHRLWLINTMGKAKDTDRSTTKSTEGATATTLKTENNDQSRKSTHAKPSTKTTTNTHSSTAATTKNKVSSSRLKTEKSGSSQTKSPSKMSSDGSRPGSSNSVRRAPSAQSIGNVKPALPPINSNNKSNENSTDNNNEKQVDSELLKKLAELDNGTECRVFELITQIMLRHGTHCSNCVSNLHSVAMQTAELADQACEVWTY